LSGDLTELEPVQKLPLIEQRVVFDTYPPGVRVGCDIVRRGRISEVIKRRGDGFASLLFNEAELARSEEGPSLELQFGLKESVLKAIGRGMSGAVDLHQVDTSSEALCVKGALAELAGDVDIVQDTTLDAEHVVTCVWLVPKEQEDPCDT
tara:strand:- start:475 stop:924 length:450 start_codon:yes stop_codon:yes gene_type:complete